jgi:hypothetical protein
MADYQAVFAVGDALVKYLTNNYDQTAVGFPCTFKLVSSTEIANEDTTQLDKTISIYLHRITTSDQFRYVTQLQDHPTDQPVMYLDLHYLVTYWDASAEGAEAEQKLLLWTMQQLQSRSILDTSVLSLSSAAPGWDKTDSIQIIPADLSFQDIMDIWDALGPHYRLSTCYIVRVVRVDRTIAPGMPVVATRFTYQNGVPA